jgi:peptidoglycan/LPS O-acetylase OafA/YrhL
LRAVAILLVIGFHAFPHAVWGGFIGVDIFFVISGFLISTIIISSLERGRFSFVEFYARRIRRIFPALMVVLTSCLVFGWFALLADEYQQLGQHVAGGAGFVANFLFWHESGYFDNAADTKPLLHLWSLGVEEQFYIAWPLVLWLAWKRHFNLFTLTFALLIASWLLNVWLVRNHQVATFYLPPTRFWELLSGSVLAQLTLHKPSAFPKLKHWLDVQLGRLVYAEPPVANGKTLRDVQSLLGALLILMGMFIITKARHFPGWWAALPVLGAVLIIAAGAQAWFNRVVLANRVLVWFGLISFPLYLWHWPLLSFARIMEGETPSRGIRLAAVGIAIILAWLTYRWIEKPLRLGTHGKAKTIGLVLLMGMVAAVGYGLCKWEGLPSRHGALTESLSPFKAAKLVNLACQHAHPDLTRNEGVRCRQSQSSAPTVLLLGDSHSGHLYQGLADEMLHSKDTLLSIFWGGCTPFFGIESRAKGGADSCTEITGYVIRFAEEHRSVHTVIMSARGALYISGVGFNEPEHNLTLSLVGKPEVTDFAEVFKIGMRETLQRLLAKQKKIIFVLDNPELGFDPKTCIESRPLRLSGKIKTPCAVSRAAFDERNRAYRELVFTVLKDFPTVQIFDAAAQLCDAEWCWAMKDGKMLYRDDDHLSVEGSRLMAKALVQRLDHSLPR